MQTRFLTVLVLLIVFQLTVGNSFFGFTKDTSVTSNSFSQSTLLPDSPAISNSPTFSRQGPPQAGSLTSNDNIPVTQQEEYLYLISANP